MKTKFKIGDKVRVATHNDNENYNSFRNKTLTIISVCITDGVGESIYNFEGIDFSLYDYELENV